jgi:hypothetical protein
MTLHELYRPAATAPVGRRFTSILRRLADVWWFGVRVHVAELNGLPKPEEPPPPDGIFPFGHL